MACNDRSLLLVANSPAHPSSRIVMLRKVIAFYVFASTLSLPQRNDERSCIPNAVSIFENTRNERSEFVFQKYLRFTCNNDLSSFVFVCKPTIASTNLNIIPVSRFRGTWESSWTSSRRSPWAAGSIGLFSSTPPAAARATEYTDLSCYCFNGEFVKTYLISHTWFEYDLTRASSVLTQMARIYTWSHET